MKKSVYKVIVAIITCAFIIVGILVGVSLINSRAMTVEQAEKRLQYMGETYANEFNTIFSDSELIVNNMANVIEKDFAVNEYIDSRQYFDILFSEADRLFKDVISNSNYPIGLYVTFNPETSGGMDEIWYVKNKNGDVFDIDSIALSDGWLVEEDDTTEYYFKTIREGSYWSDASYDPGMKGEVITYTRTLYDADNQLIGVIGTDIIVDDIFDTLEEIDKEINGDSVLIDNDKGIIAGADIKGLQNKKYIYTEASIGERWTIALAQPVSTAIEPVVKTEIAIILLGILIIITVIVLIIAYSHRKVKPIIREVEYKDIMLVNQSRQAKMGEMIGNIAHQWKQPLNSMKMALSNMNEDYEQQLLTDEEFRSYISRMNMMVNTLSETADDFITFLKPTRKEEVFSVNDEIYRVMNLMDEQLRLRSIHVECNGPDLKIKGLRNEFMQCLVNLIDNASDAMMKLSPEHRKVKITTICDHGYSQIRIFNYGKPIEHGNHIFELYFTTKEKDGTGIGLYLAKEVIRNHFHGDLYFENAAKGVTFIISIPSIKEV